jgi:hypothetical protein
MRVGVWNRILPPLEAIVIDGALYQWGWNESMLLLVLGQILSGLFLFFFPYGKIVKIL